MNEHENAVAYTRIGDAYLGLSNMSEGFPLLINGTVRIHNAENLFQALKFSDYPELQRQILSQQSPMGARILSGRLENKSRVRPDWQDIQLEVMAYCLRAKLIWNWVGFGNILRDASGRDILDTSSKTDRFWGVVQSKGGYTGMNHLGHLLMGLRDEYLSDDNAVLHRLTPPDLELRLLGEELDVIDRQEFLTRFGTRKTVEVDQRWPYRVQLSLDSRPETSRPHKKAVALV